MHAGWASPARGPEAGKRDEGEEDAEDDECCGVHDEENGNSGGGERITADTTSSIADHECEPDSSIPIRRKLSKVSVPARRGSRPAAIRSAPPSLSEYLADSSETVKRERREWYPQSGEGVVESRLAIL